MTGLKGLDFGDRIIAGIWRHFVFFFAVAAKHDSRDPKINLKINLAFLDHICRVLRLKPRGSRLPGNLIWSLYLYCRKAPQQVEISLPQCREIGTFIGSLDFVDEPSG